MFIFDSCGFTLKQVAAFPADLGTPGDREWARRETGSPRTHHPDTPLSWQHNTRLEMGVSLLQRLVSSNSCHVDRRTGSADAHGNLFAKGRLTPHPAEVAQGSSVSRNAKASKIQTHPEWLLPKIHQLQNTPVGLRLLI